MAKDILGNTVKVGDKVVFNNMVCTVKDIQENRVLGGKMITFNKGTGIKIPDNMTLEIDVQFDGDKPLNIFVVKQPTETVGAEA